MTKIVKILTSFNVTFLVILLSNSDSGLEHAIYGAILAMQIFSLLTMLENSRKLDSDFVHIRLDFLESEIVRPMIEEIRKAINDDETHN